jgi:hypothetical protein
MLLWGRPVLYPCFQCDTIAWAPRPREVVTAGHVETSLEDVLDRVVSGRSRRIDVERACYRALTSSAKQVNTACWQDFLAARRPRRARAAAKSALRGWPRV